MRANRLFAIAFAVLLLASGCQKRAKATAPQPVASPPAAVLALERADRAFSAGNYSQAMQAYEESLRLAPPASLREQALFRLGLTYVLRSGVAPDWDRAVAAFKKLASEFPESPLKPPALLIVSLRAEADHLVSDAKTRDQRIRQLTTELDKLKQIDAQRRTRP
jgi:tetratricopeptide (TPR) repeat protein